MTTSTNAVPNVAELAAALAEFADDDRRLARALTVHETWKVGYVSCILDSAAVIAANGQLSPDGTELSAEETARVAVARVIDDCNPRMVLSSVTLQPFDEEVESLVNLLHAKAQFLHSAIALERRGLRRVPLAR